MSNTTFIVVKTQFQGIHRYTGAPDEVAFLRQPHRHMFYVELEMQVFNNDRELEFLLVKKSLDNFIKLNYGMIDLGNKSCEMIAEEIQKWAKKYYYLDAHQYPNVSFRKVNVKVFEDNENGCYLKED